ncbi:MAG TPA: PP2C family protein-serine/threonine phosphatase [Caulobacteraceae bacterium]|nr:PP2C family protein-serine/threonine phosphatase [Caulobacteraceae bacterium]
MRLPFRLQALANLAIVRLSLIFAVIWAALICAGLFGLARARLDVGQTAAVEANLATAAVSQALVQAPRLYDPQVQAALASVAPKARRAVAAAKAGKVLPAIAAKAPTQALAWSFDSSQFRSIVGKGALPAGGSLHAALAAGRPAEGPILVGGHAYWAILQPVGSRGRIQGAYGAATPFRELDEVVQNLAATPAFVRGFLAVVDARGRLLFASSGSGPAMAPSGAKGVLAPLGRLAGGYQLTRSPVGATKMQVIAGVSHAELNLQTLKLVGTSQSFLAMVIVVSVCLAWLLARRLTGALEDAERSRAVALEAKAEAERAGEALTDELRQAARYVASLLPARDETGPVATDWLYRPSLDLGGDAFGYLWLDERRFAFYLLDVCGHGVGAALLSTTVMNVIRARTVNADFTDPSSVLAALNVAFPMERQNDLYFTIWYGVYDLATETVRYASGGQHPAVLIAPDEQPTLLQGRGAPIGFFDKGLYPAFSAQAPAGSQLYVFSDGLFEVELGSGRGMLDLDSFVEILADRRTRSPQRVLAAVLEAIQVVQGKEGFDDDCSILQLSFRHAERSRLLA